MIRYAIRIAAIDEETMKIRWEFDAAERAQPT